MSRCPRENTVMRNVHDASDQQQSASSLPDNLRAPANRGTGTKALAGSLRASSTNRTTRRAALFRSVSGEMCEPGERYVEAAALRYTEAMSTATILDREEYVEQAYLFRNVRERLAENQAAQDVFTRIHEELLSSTRLPYACSSSHRS